MATKAVPVICQFVFHQENPAFSPAIPTDSAGGTTLPAGAGTVPADQAPTKTTTPESAIPTAIGSGKSNSNDNWQTDGIGADFEHSNNINSDDTSVVSVGTSDTDFDYSRLREKFPTRSENSP